MNISTIIHQTLRDFYKDNYRLPDTIAIGCGLAITAILILLFLFSERKKKPLFACAVTSALIATLSLWNPYFTTKEIDSKTDNIAKWLAATSHTLAVCPNEAEWLLFYYSNNKISSNEIFGVAMPESGSFGFNKKEAIAISEALAKQGIAFLQQNSQKGRKQTDHSKNAT